MRIKTIPLDNDLVKNFSDSYKVNSYLAQFFLRRGIISPEELAYSLETDLRYTHNPFLFEAMEDVVERITQAVAEQEKILIFGDRDVDGITSIASLLEFLQEQGAQVQWRMPMDDDAYGITSPVVEEFAEAEGTLIITVDCGISALAPISRASELGIDVIIIDHHNPQDELPPAIAIINPKLSDCTYPFDGLSAAALCAKVVWALRFSLTALYNQEYCIIHAKPGNESIYFDAIVIKNMRQVRHLSEVLAGEYRNTVIQRIIPFIQNLPLFVYQKEEQLKIFTSIFGKVDIALTDLAPVLWDKFPAMKGKSPIRLLAQSKTVRYRSQKPAEIDILAQALLLYLSEQLVELEQKYKESLSLTALSLVADMMPMNNENRILMRVGMQTLAALPKEKLGLHSILVELDLVRKPLMIRDIGWKIAPLINSSGRMGKPDIALRLLVSKDPSECLSLVKELSSLNNERKKLGETAWKILNTPLRQSMQNHKNKLALAESDQIQRGITGILAGRFARELDCSVIILAKVQDTWVGSIRTMQGLGATWLLEQCSDLLGDYGGHDAAAGFFLQCERLTEFKQRIQNIIETWQAPVQEEELIYTDILIRACDLTEDCWTLTQNLLPYGQAFPQPVILLEKAIVVSAQLMGKDSRHLSLQLECGKRQWQAVMWDGSDKYKKVFSTGDTIDALICFETNNFRTSTTQQIIIQDLERSN